MLKYVLILLFGLICEAVGVVYLSRGLKQIGEPAVLNFAAVLGLIRQGATNPSLLFLLSRADVSFIWPLTSLGLVLTTLAARYLLREEVSVVRWSGVVLIVLGSLLITYSEQTRKKPKLETGPAAAIDVERPPL
jgi:uncharacterized membrane protein